VNRRESGSVVERTAGRGRGARNRISGARAGVLAAYSSPAEGYELSIYGATPVAFWVALFVVAVVSVSVSLYDRRYLPLAVLLGDSGPRQSPDSR